MLMLFLFFFFNDTATTEIYTLSLHDALPIGTWVSRRSRSNRAWGLACQRWSLDRKSTRLNSSHVRISYAVFCLKKKKQPGTHHGYPRQPPPSYATPLWQVLHLQPSLRRHLNL